MTLSRISVVGFVLLAIGLLGGCRQEEPQPPGRNVFYEVQIASPSAGPGQGAGTTTVSAESLSIAVADQEVLAADLEASWSVNWHCLSERCQFTECVGSAQGRVRDVVDERWLRFDRRIEWNDSCGKPTSWLSQVDRYTGAERYPSQQGRFFSFWAGSRAATGDREIELADGRRVTVWCSGPQQSTVTEEDGWTTLYDGEVCYDVRTGILVHMSYIKRWVFTGTFEGAAYEEAYFGDSETYEQLLETTNAELAWVP